jgi:hypothetical protein
MAVHRAPYACAEEPLHQLRAADAERVLKILLRAGAEAVDGNREAFDKKFGHGMLAAA